MQANDGADLEGQLASKEREWKELQTLRFQQQETSLRDAREQLTLLRQRFQQLREDFRFNLAVLEDRDRELERYDAMFAQAQVTESTRQEEVSQLRIQVDKLQEVKEREAGEREEDLRRSQRRAAEHRLQLEKLQSSYAGDIQKQREEFEQIKRELQRRVQEVEGELALQKQEMMTDFDNELRRREHEFNLRMDEMRAVVLSHELRVKLVSKETEVHVKARAQAVEDLNASEERLQHTLSQLQHRDWEIKDITSVKDSRIKELEDQSTALQTKRKSEEEIFNRKHEDLDRSVRQIEAQMDALREAHGEQLRQTENHTTRLQSQLDAMTTHTRRTQRQHEDTLRERDEQIDRLRTELETTRCGWDSYITQVSRETVAKDTELMALQERESKLRTELDRSRGETERYKQQLSESLEREKALEQRRVQVELEWQRRCEDSKAEHYLNSEALIQGLTQARDQASAELRGKQREIQDMVVLLNAVTMERDKALGLPIKEQVHRPGGDGGAVVELRSDEIHHLQQQNSSLRAVIAQMRKDMEELSQTTHAPGPSNTSTQAPKGPLPQSAGQSSGQTTDTGLVPRLAGTPGPDYTQALEGDVAVLKARCRRLEEQLEGATRPLDHPVNPTPTLAHVAPDNAYLQNHIRSLNETIGGLRVDKVANTASLRKQEVRIAHLEAALASLTQQCHTKQMEGEELRLELANQKRNWSSEDTSLRQRLVAIEMELEEVRREKEEYQKGSILNNLESVALGNQVSALKLNIASRNEPIICEESEMVRQLQEENLCLRQQQLSTGLKPGRPAGCGPERGIQGGKVHVLQSKLRQAVVCIGRLTRDKQQLIEMGNRLRAQLADTGLEAVNFATTPSVAPEPMEPERDSTRDTQAQQNQSGRLSALEQLQYQLTKQELQYAQRDQRNGAPVLVRPVISDRDRVTNPWGQSVQDTNPHEPRRIQSSPVPLSPSQSPLQLDVGSGPPSSPFGPLLLSSVETEGSLREVWQILDRGLSPSMLTARESSSDRGDVELVRPELSEPGSASQVRGIQEGGASIPERKKPARSSATDTARKTMATARRGRIRNYNIRD